MPFTDWSVMNRETLINEVSTRTGVSKRKVSAVLKVLLTEITEALSREERVEIRQFGSFAVKNRKARIARNLQSNEVMPLRDRPMPHFVPFNHLKHTVSERPANSEKPGEESLVPEQPAKLEISREEVPFPMQPETPGGNGDEYSVQTQVQRKEKREDRSNDISSMLSRAETLAGKGKFEQAIQQYRRILERDPRHMTATGLIGRMYYMLGSNETAMQYYDRVLGNDPSHMDTLVDRGELYAVMGYYEEAKIDLLRALEYEPFSYEACYQLGLLYITTGAYESAVKILTRAQETGQGKPEIHLQLGKAYCHMERNDEAIEHLEILLGQQPDNRQAYRYLGMIYDKTRQIDRALEMYRKSNEIGMG